MTATVTSFKSLQVLRLTAPKRVGNTRLGIGTRVRVIHDTRAEREDGELQVRVEDSTKSDSAQGLKFVVTNDEVSTVRRGRPPLAEAAEA